MNRAITLSSLVLAMTSNASIARAGIEDQLNSGEIIAVDERPYRLVHEFSVSTGVIPNDAFFVGISLGGAYTLHLSDIWAWEAVNFQYSANISTNLEDELLDSFEVQPELEPRLQYLLTTSAIVSPFFGKQAVLNRDVVFQGVYFALGGGVANFSGDDENSFRPQAQFGPGVRFFFGQVVSARLDLRGITTFETVAENLDVEFFFHGFLSISFNFGTVRATEIGTEKVVDNTTGFEKLDELYPESNPNIVVIKESESDEK
ncbi:MAG: outer membrane beta-barrel domain-containing protein [Myxococcota bacterium]